MRDEITDEMYDAGIDAYMKNYKKLDRVSQLVAVIYERMELARRKASSVQGNHDDLLKDLDFAASDKRTPKPNVSIDKKYLRKAAAAIRRLEEENKKFREAGLELVERLDSGRERERQISKELKEARELLERVPQRIREGLPSGAWSRKMQDSIDRFDKDLHTFLSRNKEAQDE